MSRGSGGGAFELGLATVEGGEELTLPVPTNDGGGTSNNISIDSGLATSSPVAIQSKHGRENRDNGGPG